MLKVKAGTLPQVKMVMESLVEKEFSFKRSISIARLIANELSRETALVDQLRIKLCKDKALKDEKGEPLVTEDGKNFIMSKTKELLEQLANLKKIDPLPTEKIASVEKELKENQKIDMDFQEKLMELFSLDVELDFEPFTEKELEAIKLAPKAVIVLGELGFIKDFKKNFETSDFKVEEPSKK